MNTTIPDGDMDMDDTMAPPAMALDLGLTKKKQKKRRAKKPTMNDAMTDDMDDTNNSEANLQKHADPFPSIPGVNRHGAMVFSTYVCFLLPHVQLTCYPCSIFECTTFASFDEQ